jgi:hypothetical protein
MPGAEWRYHGDWLMVTTLLMLGWLLAQGGNAPAPAASSSSPAPSLSSWRDEVKNPGGAFPRLLTFVTALPEDGPPKFLQFDTDEFNKLGFFQAASAATAAWDIKLNKGAFAGQNSLQVAQELTHADTVVLAPEKGDWKILRVKDGKRVQLASAKPAKSAKPADLMDWLPEALGWDGVVLAQSGDFLLVGSTKSLLAQPEIQALAVSSSEKKLILNPGEREGAGLLSLRETTAGLAVFDIVFLGQGVSSLPPGTKLIIEKRKK